MTFKSTSNILADYFAAVVPTTAKILHLTPMLSSILLYIAGIVSNDILILK